MRQNVDAKLLGSDQQMVLLIQKVCWIAQAYFFPGYELILGTVWLDDIVGP